MLIVNSLSLSFGNLGIFLQYFIIGVKNRTSGFLQRIRHKHIHTHTYMRTYFDLKNNYNNNGWRLQCG